MKNLKPFVIYNDKILDRLSWFFKIGGIALFPVIILRERYQQKRYVLYVLEWLLKVPFYGKGAYRNISFEREAYGNESDINYLVERKRYNWLTLIF